MPGKTSEALNSGDSWPWWATTWLAVLTLWLALLHAGLWELAHQPPDATVLQAARTFTLHHLEEYHAPSRD